MNELMNVGWTKDEIAEKIANECFQSNYQNCPD